MPTRPSKNVVPKTIELAREIVERAEAFAAERGQSFRALVEKALTRHMDHPPPVVVDPPLPACEPDRVPAKKPKKFRARRKKT